LLVWREIEWLLTEAADVLGLAFFGWAGRLELQVDGHESAVGACYDVAGGDAVPDFDAGDGMNPFGGLDLDKSLATEEVGNLRRRSVASFDKGLRNHDAGGVFAGKGCVSFNLDIVSKDTRVL
jgi:hypothetical protein